MNFQRALEAMLRRFGDVTGQWGPGSVTSIAEVAVPVIPIGSDRTDFERVVFVGLLSGNAAAGNTPKLVLEAQSGDVELVAAWCSRNGGNVNVGLRFDDSQGFSIMGFNTTSSSGRAPLLAAPRHTGSAPSGIVTAFEKGADETLYLPLRGTVLPEGRQVTIESTVLGSGLNGGFAWRELGALTL